MTVRNLSPGTRFRAAGTWYTLRKLGQGSAVVTIGDGAPQEVTIGDRTFTANNTGRTVTISLGTVVEERKEK